MGSSRRTEGERPGVKYDSIQSAERVYWKTVPVVFEE